MNSNRKTMLTTMTLKLSAGILLIIMLTGCKSGNQATKRQIAGHGYIEVSGNDRSYFSFSDGTPYIPIGINMISPGSRYKNNPDSSLSEFGQWMKKLSENGGNYMRIWLSSPFWDIEDQKAGEFREEKAKRIDRLIEMARKYNLRIKMTLEHFRSITLEENPQPWAVKSVYHTSNGGPLDSVRQFLSSRKGKDLFLSLIDYYSHRYGSDTIFFGWELWNEMNALHVPQDSLFFSWNKEMAGEVKRRFPENMVMQSLGSFDADRVRPLYKKMMLMSGNQVAQVHRYLDAGAELETCHEPIDIICSSAIDEILAFNTDKPVILAETGAVEPRHTGPSRYYSADTAGIILHDILFAPFFSGAAGSGMSWHWDSYVDKNNLWYHFKRFSETVRGIDPAQERFIPSRTEKDDIRIYKLTGEKTVLLWLRDKRNNWQSELRDSIPPLLVSGLRFDLDKEGIQKPYGEIMVYDPWKDKWKKETPDGNEILLPDFKRSLVIRIEKM